MTDPRKPIIQPSAEDQDGSRAIALRHLMKATEQGSREIGCGGASFVMMGIGIWAAELTELDAKATSRMLAALSVVYDPAANPTQKAHAERKRQAAVKKLFNALDIEMATPAGSA